MARDKQNKRWLHDWAWSIKGTGSVLAAQGHFAEAVKDYEDAATFLEELVRDAPTNVPWRRDLSNTYLLMGHALKAQGDLAGASARYAAAMLTCPRPGVELEWLVSLQTPIDSIPLVRECPFVASKTSESPENLDSQLTAK